MSNMTHKVTGQDLKNSLVDLIAKVPGKNKKINPKVNKSNSDLFVYTGTTEFDGQTVLFFASIAKMFDYADDQADTKITYRVDIEPLSDYYSGREIALIFGDHNKLAQDEDHDDTVTDKIRKKLAEYNAYDVDERAGDLDYSFLYHKFTNIQTPRLYWFTESLLDLYQDITVPKDDAQDKLAISDLTPAEVEKAQQTGPDAKLPYDVTPAAEEKFVKKATDVFLQDIARICRQLPDQRDSHFFNLDAFFEDDEDNDPSTYGPIVYNEEDYNEAIMFTDTVSPDHKCKVELYDKKGNMVGTDTVRLLCDTYELRYGLYEITAKENQEAIAKLNQKYDNDHYPEFEDNDTIRKIAAQIFSIDLDRR